MKVLVTGGRGFIGQFLVEKLKKLDYEVFVMDREDGDIVNYRFRGESLDHIIHLAASTFVPYSWDNPLEFYKTNTLGTTAVLEICRKFNCSLTYISSYVYGIPDFLPISETHAKKPNTPYNHSKVLAEEICLFYNQFFNIPVTVLRPFNIFGPGQSEQFLIPTIIEQVFSSDSDTIDLQNLMPRRDYLYVDDFTNGILATINKNGFNVYNIGSGKSLSVLEIVKTIMDVAGIQKQIIESGIVRNNEVNDVVADISLITKELNWKPKTSFADGINEIVKLRKSFM